MFVPSRSIGDGIILVYFLPLILFDSTTDAAADSWIDATRACLFSLARLLGVWFVCRLACSDPGCLHTRTDNSN